MGAEERQPIGLALAAMGTVQERGEPFGAISAVVLADADAPRRCYTPGCDGD
jgi:hypothetical protein